MLPTEIPLGQALPILFKTKKKVVQQNLSIKKVTMGLIKD